MTRLIATVTLCAAMATPSAAQNIDIGHEVHLQATADCGACMGHLSVGLHQRPMAFVADTPVRKAIEYSDAYATRLKIHQIGSYAILPLFAAEYLLGEQLLDDRRDNFGSDDDSGANGPHAAVAVALGAVFTANTVTGLWNLAESRKDPAGRTRRWLHTIGMLVADAGFVLTAGAAGDAGETNAGADRHRNLAIASIGVATVSTIMMWLWKD